MKTGSVSVGKPDGGCVNEDAVLARDGIVAVSDGAGGGGLFAERWSRYLLAHLPDEPIRSAGELDEWLGRIWEPFYERCEAEAGRAGAMSLDKFYDEGSFATLAAVWRTSAGTCRWMSFGDSVAFHYDRGTGVLEHSFGPLADFDDPPYLINCKDRINGDGFKGGEWNVGGRSLVFAASDALAHYVLMMYEAGHKDDFAGELREAASRRSRNGNYVNMAMASRGFDFEKDVLRKLTNCLNHAANFERHLRSLIRKGLLAVDDYSFAACEPCPPEAVDVPPAPR